jgi:WD40 repeat protein
VRAPTRARCRGRRLACDSTVNALAFTADALVLASGGMDKKVRVWDMSTGVCNHELVHDDYVLALAFAPAQRAPEVRTAAAAAAHPQPRGAPVSLRESLRALPSPARA